MSTVAQNKKAHKAHIRTQPKYIHNTSTISIVCGKYVLFLLSDKLLHYKNLSSRIKKHTIAFHKLHLITFYDALILIGSQNKLVLSFTSEVWRVC